MTELQFLYLVVLGICNICNIFSTNYVKEECDCQVVNSCARRPSLQI